MEDPNSLFFRNQERVISTKARIKQPPIDHPILDRKRALDFLEKNFKKFVGFPSYIAPDGDFTRRTPSPPEIFSCLLISQCLLDMGIRPWFFDSVPQLIALATNRTGYVHFFLDHKLLVADVDCTAVGCSILLEMKQPPDTLQLVVDSLLRNTNNQGIIEVYEKPAGKHEGRIDACVLVNALHLFYSLNREDEARPSEDFVSETLTQQNYLLGTRYYPSPEAFLYFLSRLVRDYPKARRRHGKRLLKELFERRNASDSFLDLALRCAALDNLGKCTPKYRETIIRQQYRGGYWPAVSVFKYGGANRYFGGEALSTAIGLRASTPVPPKSVNTMSRTFNIAR